MGNEVFVYAGVGTERLVARVEPQTLPEPGATISLVLDENRLHLFDAETGRSRYASTAEAAA